MTQTRFTHQRQKSRRMMQLLVFAGLLGFVVSTAAVSRALRIPRVSVNGFVMPVASIDEWAVAYSKRWESELVTLIVDNQAYRISRGELGAKLPEDVPIHAVQNISEESDDENIPQLTWVADVDHGELLETVFELRELTLVEGR